MLPRTIGHSSWLQNPHFILVRPPVSKSTSALSHQHVKNNNQTKQPSLRPQPFLGYELVENIFLPVSKQFKAFTINYTRARYQREMVDAMDVHYWLDDLVSLCFMWPIKSLCIMHGGVYCSEDCKLCQLLLAKLKLKNWAAPAFTYGETILFSLYVKHTATNNAAVAVPIISLPKRGILCCPRFPPRTLNKRKTCVGATNPYGSL